MLTHYYATIAAAAAASSEIRRTEETGRTPVPTVGKCYNSVQVSKASRLLVVFFSRATHMLYYFTNFDSTAAAPFCLPACLPLSLCFCLSF